VRGPSIVMRVVLGMVLVAALSSLALAAGAAVTARFLWRSRERETLRETTTAFIRSMKNEAAEDRIPFEQAAAETILESALAGYRIEIWRGPHLIASSKEGTLLGPRPGDGSRFLRTGWVLHTHDLPGGLTLIMALPEETGKQTLAVFTGSLYMASPLSLLVAIVVGLALGRRATRPLIDFTERVSRTDTPRVLEPTKLRRIPREVVDLEESFRHLLTRLTEAVSRELEFAANASHELRTPLTRLRLHAERAREDSGADGREALTAQLEEIDRIARLIDSLLVMSRDAVEGIPCGEVVNLADLVRGLIDRGSTTETRASGDMPDEALVRGDENLLCIPVENLLDNAQKYGTRRPRVELRLFEQSGRLTLTVTSPGSRVPSEARERLFERFYRDPKARTLHPGHGLGLPLSRHIARLHGGDVGCRSSQDEDASFFLDLPLWKPTNPPVRDSRDA